MRVPPPGSTARDQTLPHAGELFTDREAESDVLKKALAAFRRYLDRDDETGSSRHNVLTFYGMGGIGKTALSERLEAWVRRRLPLTNGWGPPPATRVDTTARIDLHGSAGQIDVLSALLSLRAGVAALRPRWPVFDLAFTAYWSAIRPGEPLPTFRGTQLNDVVADTAGSLLEDIGNLATSSADLVIPGAGAAAGLGVYSVRKLIGEVRRRRDLQLAIDAYSGFDRFLLRCADEPSATEPRPTLACEIGGALAWELSRIEPTPLLAVFVDTTERLHLDPRRTSEGYLNRLIHRMPNVLFILTGRDMLTWSNENRLELPHRGPWTWPGLVPGASEEPRQHRIGNLSPHDTRTVILRARQLLELPISEPVIDKLVESSAGLPQYLELARQVAVSIKESGSGRQVKVEDVTGSLDSLVMRVLDDIPADEQRALRAACLFRIFDTELVAAAGDVDHGCAERAVTRPMIDRYEGERFPYRMHDAIRDAIRRADHKVANGWADRDWQLAAQRAAEGARRLHDTAKTNASNVAVLDAIGIAIRLVCDHNVTLTASSSPTYRDWLVKAILYSPSVAGLRSRVPGSSRTAYGQHVLDFITAKSPETPLAERLKLLRRIFESDHPLRIPAGRHLGYTLRAGALQPDAAVAVFDELVERDPSPINRRQRAYTLSLGRRMREAEEKADDDDTRRIITRVAAYAHGRPDRYFQEVDAKLEQLRKSGRQREYLEERADLILRRTFFGRDVELGEILALQDELELVGHSVGIRGALLAQLLHPETESDAVAVALERLDLLDRTSADGTAGFRYMFGAFCDAAVLGDRNRLLGLRERTNAKAWRSRAWIPVECFFEAFDLPLNPIPTQWLEPYDEVLHRWTEHLDRFLARRGATRERRGP